MDYYVLTRDRSIFRRTYQGWQRLASSSRNNGLWLSSPGPDGDWVEAGWFDTPPNLSIAHIFAGIGSSNP